MATGEIKIFNWNRGNSLRETAKLARSPLSVHDGDRQLDYIARYIEKTELNSAVDRCVLIEPHYIDRDFLEDCSAFYVQNLDPPENHCKRLHFFACSAETVSDYLRRIRTARRSNSSEYQRLCSELSDRFYLGFTVIRPLPGCPVGRTVLRCHGPEPTSGGFRR